MKDLDFQKIGQQIRKRRLECGVTQEALANQLDVNPSHISNIENGRAKPSLTVLVKIADFLDCSVDFSSRTNIRIHSMASTNIRSTT